MTTSEFKKDYPSMAHLEGNDLWDAMELVMLQSQSEPSPDEEVFIAPDLSKWGFMIPKGNDGTPPPYFNFIKDEDKEV